jgi:hypothetical protein
VYLLVLKQTKELGVAVKTQYPQPWQWRDDGMCQVSLLPCVWVVLHFVVTSQAVQTIAADMHCLKLVVVEVLLLPSQQLTLINA